MTRKHYIVTRTHVKYALPLAPLAHLRCRPPMSGAPKHQFDKFRDLARELECDDDEAAFKAKLVKIAKAPSRAPKPKGAS